MYHERDIRTNTNVMQACGAITDVKTIAERLKHAREELGLSQEEVAVRAKVSQGTIGNIESGARKSPRELLAIAAAVSVSPQWLATGRDAAPHAISTTSLPPDLANRLAALSDTQRQGVLAALRGTLDAVAPQATELAPQTKRSAANR